MTHDFIFPTVRRPSILLWCLIYDLVSFIILKNAASRYLNIDMMFRKVMSRALVQFSRVNNSRFASQTVETNNMERTINQVTLLGRVGADPQERGTKEHPVVIFSMATHVNYKYESGEFMQKTDWHRVCIFKPSLRKSVSSYLKKGQRVLVNGRVSYGEFKDEEGNSRPTTAIIADDLVYFTQ